MAPEALAQVLRQLEPLFPTMQHPAVLVGLNAPDDAGVYQLNAERALIATTDFFTPIVDDPYTFGAIAATNAMSDVYAMGGEVLFALNIAAFPESLPAEVIAQILLGGAEQVRRAGSIILGGHTIKNPEPLYGLAVVGEVHPARLFRKTGVQVGDTLILTKALGTGLISTAAKRDQADADDLETAIVSMLTLGRSAMLAGQAASVRCATDITGFGLLGHACEMAERGAGALQLSLDALPLLPGTRQIFVIDVESVQTSCGWGVPMMEPELLQPARAVAARHQHGRRVDLVRPANFRRPAPGRTGRTVIHILHNLR